MMQTRTSSTTPAPVLPAANTASSWPNSSDSGVLMRMTCQSASAKPRRASAPEVTVDMSPAPMSVSTPHSISRPFSPLDTISAPGNVLTPLRLQNITFCNSKVKYYKTPKYASS